jgi:glycosyltransferase involved in cell wall biosynthesis
MASGVPVVCSNATSLPEVVGEAGLLLPPDDVAAWAEALDRVLSEGDLRAELRARGLARARLFTWEAAARKTLEVYQAVVGGRVARHI